MLGLQSVFPLYVTMPESYYPDIEKAEKFDDVGNELFEKLSEEILY
jgi:anaerobic magnesium-protoporphyrin IX monomethyl ester cyclase